MARSVLAAFNELLARQSLTDNQRQTALVRVRTLGDFFASNFVMRSAPFAIGSYARGTMCAGERDIDLLAPLEPFGKTDYWGLYEDDSSKFLYAVRNVLNSRHGSTQVSSKRVAVTLDFNDIVTDIVPAFPREGSGFLIPDGNGGWKSTNPPVHTNLIHQADQAHGLRLKALIKLMKAWNIANSHHLASFHIELLMERIWRGFQIGDWPSAMAATLKVMPAWVRESFDDPWPDGGTISNYLSADDRARVIRMLESDAVASAEAQRLASAGYVESAFERWSVVYRHTFPAYR